MSQMKLKLNH